MDSILGAFITSRTLILVSAVGWFSLRATRESRLLMKVERFGNAYALIPESPEKAELRKYFLRSVQELTREHDDKPKRFLVNAVTFATSILGIALVFIVIPQRETSSFDLANLVFQVALGLILGLFIGGINFLATWLISRRESKKAFEQRADRFVRGEA